MISFFENCISLITIPNISNWDISNHTKINRMFYNCSSLISLPDISNWKCSKDIKIDKIFNYSDSINDLSGLNTNSNNNALSFKINSESNNNSEKILSDKIEINSNIYYNFDYFDEQNDDSQYYYEDFYPN